MKVYVATKYEEWPRAKDVAERLTAWGHQITFRWWEVQAPKQEKAVMDLAGVHEADALVVLFEYDLPYRGAFVEFGVALGAGKPIFILGNAIDEDMCVFVAHPLVCRGWGAFQTFFRPVFRDPGAA